MKLNNTRSCPRTNPKRSRSSIDVKVPCLKTAEEAREDLKQKLAEVAKAAQETVIHLTGSLPTAPIVQTLLQISATTDLAMGS